MSQQVRLEPAGPVVAGAWGTWRISYTAGPPGIAVGGGVEIAYHVALLPIFRVEGDWTPPQVDDSAAPGYTTATTTGAARVRVVVVPPEVPLPDLPAGPARTVRVLVEESPLLPGERIIVTFGDTGGGGPGTRAQHIAQRGFEFTVRVDHDGSGDWTRLEESPRLDILGGPATRLLALAPSIVPVGEEFSLAVVPLDAFGHAATGFTAPLALESSDPKAELAPGEAQVGAGLRLGTPGVQRITVTGGGFRAESNPITSTEFTVSEAELLSAGLVEAGRPPLRLYWGDIHGHSNLSDGLRSPDDYYGYARDVVRLDFAVLTDHEPGWGARADDRQQWDTARRKAVEYYEPGRFVTFSAYEWTSGRYGHKCVYYLTDDQPLFTAWDPASDTPARLYAALRGRAAMVITHHPAGGPVGADLAAIDPAWEPLVEIYSCHGCSETPGVGRPLWRRPDGGFYVQQALDRGYRFGVIAGSDTHTSDPGNPLPAHPLFPHPHRVGLMAVYATALTREALWEALWARRVYGTTGERILLDFRVNGHGMGEEVVLSAPPVLRAQVAGTAPLVRVELIRNGEVVLAQQANGPDLTFTWQDDDVYSGYYYLRVTQADGEMAWSSPIWVARGEGAGGRA